MYEYVVFAPFRREYDVFVLFTCLLGCRLDIVVYLLTALYVLKVFLFRKFMRVLALLESEILVALASDVLDCQFMLLSRLGSVMSLGG